MDHVSPSTHVPLTLDGSFGEGGGSILRVAIGLACVLNHPIKIINIRTGRENPGLRLQHLVGIETLVKVSGGTSSPLAIGTTEVEFYPGNLRLPSLEVDIRTAGSVGLFSQTIQNGLILLPSESSDESFRVHIKGGGTFGTFAPSAEYLNRVTFALFRQIGYDVKLDVRRQGFYPKGGADSFLSLHPQKKAALYRGLMLPDRGELTAVMGTVHAEARLETPQVAERIIASVKQGEQNPVFQGLPIEMTAHYHSSLSIGVGVDLWATFSTGAVLGIGTILGERGVSSEEIGRRAFQALITLLKGPATVDSFASDQILPLLAISPHASEFILPEITSHFSTNLTLVQRLLGRSCSIDKISAGFRVKFPEIVQN